VLESKEVPGGAEMLRVTYRLAVAPGEAEARAEELAREQTVEVPRAALRGRRAAELAQGRVESLRADAAGGALATIAYPVAVTAAEPAQLVNVIFGNSSLHADVECVDLDVPAALARALRGPCFGIEGLRKLVSVWDRPLTCTAVKPLGLAPAELAELAYTFACAGIDVIKDDHGLGSQASAPFEERVPRCLEAVERAARETGRRALYAPNLLGTPEALVRQLRFAQDHGARAVLVSPMLVGLPAFWELCHRHASVPVLAHPAFGGAQRIAPEALFGRLLRLFGADATIFVSFGSRFAAGRESCRRLAANLRAPWQGLAPSLPVPAGGIAAENAAEVVRFYGRDSMLLVGGSLQAGPGSVAARSREFVRTVERAAQGLSAPGVFTTPA
jgi:ribulose-bisphosphate carboxylase large chain